MSKTPTKTPTKKADPEAEREEARVRYQKVRQKWLDEHGV